MEENKKESSNKGLVILLCVLVVVIAGLGIGIAVVLNARNNDEAAVDGGSVDGVEEMIEEYQEMIDASVDENEKADLYLERASKLKEEMINGGGDYCGQMMSDIDYAKKLSVAEEYGTLIEAMSFFCNNDGVEFTVEVGDD